MNQLIDLVGRVVANGLGHQGFNPSLGHSKHFKKNGTWYLFA